MKAGCRPQYHRIRRMVQMVREGSETGCLPNSRDFMGEFGASRGAPSPETWISCATRSAPRWSTTSPAWLPADRRDLQPASGGDQPPGGLRLRPRAQAAGPLRSDPAAHGHARGLEKDRRAAGGRHQHRAGLAEPSVSACCPKTACGPTRKCGRKWRANAGKRCGRTIRASPHGFRGTACTPCTCSPIVR